MRFKLGISVFVRRQRSFPAPDAVGRAVCPDINRAKMLHVKHIGGNVWVTRPRDESAIRQEQNDLAFRLLQAGSLRTMHVIVPDAVPGFDFLAFFGTVAVVLGAFYGGYCCWTRGLDIAQASEATAYATWAIFNIAGDFTVHLAPTSKVLFVVGWVVRWIFGLYFSVCAGIGALFGAGAVWIVIKILGAFHHALG